MLTHELEIGNVYEVTIHTQLKARKRIMMITVIAKTAEEARNKAEIYSQAEEPDSKIIGVTIVPGLVLI